MARVEKAGRLLNRDVSGDAITAEVSLDDDSSNDRNRFSPSKHAMVSQELQTLINKRDMELNYRDHQESGLPPKPRLKLDTGLIESANKQYERQESEIEKQAEEKIEKEMEFAAFVAEKSKTQIQQSVNKFETPDQK